MSSLMRLLILYLLLTFAGPIFLLFTGKVDFESDYRTADRESAHIAPDPATTHEAVIQVYAARTFNWRGLFSVHTWIAIKKANATQYMVYQVVGWRLYRHLPPLYVAEDIPDRYWFNQKPTVILDLRGAEAEKLIPAIEAAVATYPFPNDYVYWPGPNSNTFTAYIARHVPQLQLTLPSNAVGKDYFPNLFTFTRAPSGTGYQFSFYGLLGFIVAYKEGLEINFLGLVYGFNPFTRTLKLPGFGDLRFA